MLENYRLYKFRYLFQDLYYTRNVFTTKFLINYSSYIYSDIDKHRKAQLCTLLYIPINRLDI